MSSLPVQMHHIRGATRYGQLLWYTVLGPSNTQKIKSQKLVLGTHSCQQIGLFWDPWYFPCSMHTLGALCCCHRQTHRRPCSLYGQTWHRHSQSQQGVSLTSLHCHYFHVSYCKKLFLKKKMNSCSLGAVAWIFEEPWAAYLETCSAMLVWAAEARDVLELQLCSGSCLMG